MAVHTNRRGLNLPILGAPEGHVDAAAQPRRVALLGADYVGMKPTMLAKPGDAVRRGQPLFEDKKTPGIRYASPAEGKVVAVHRGDQRAFVSMVIELSATELGGRNGAEQRYGSYSGRSVEALSGDQVRELLLESGCWPALRVRPFSRVADPATRPKSIFVTAMDSNPLAPPMAPIVAERGEDLRQGLLVLAKLTDGAVFVCQSRDQPIEVPAHERLRVEDFRGPHPAGTAGWHIHTLDPVDRNKRVWHIGLQDVIAFGHLFRTGTMCIDRIVSIAGPGVRRPRLLRTRLGAGLDDVVKAELVDGDQCVISGSVFAGRPASGDTAGYLGRYHQQISVLAIGNQREFLGWMSPGFGKFSVLGTFVSKLMPGKRFAFNTSLNGSHRAIIPVGVYERMFPFDLPPTHLLRSLAVHDLEKAEEYGALELDEEDLALCTFVDPGKNDFGPSLRRVLTTLEKEG